MIPRHRRIGHGSVLRRIRRAAGYTVVGLAQVIGRSESEVSRRERGVRPVSEVAVLVYSGLARRAGLDVLARVMESA